MTYRSFLLLLRLAFEELKDVYVIQKLSKQASKQTNNNNNNNNNNNQCRTGLSSLKAMVAKDIEQSHLFLLRHSVILSVVDYSLGLTTLSQPNPLKLDSVQNEAMRGTTEDTPIEATRYLLDLPPTRTRHKVEQN